MPESDINLLIVIGLLLWLVPSHVIYLWGLSDPDRRLGNTFGMRYYSTVWLWPFYSLLTVAAVIVYLACWALDKINFR